MALATCNFTLPLVHHFYRVEAAALDARFGYEPLLEGPPRLGWLFNMVGTVIEEGSVELAAVDLYFVEQVWHFCFV
jgi:hypothetical protein